jgi:acyl-homoserine lactone acylase PvdQ
VYADDHGHIGAISAGYYPQVAHGDPWLPLPGTGAGDVTGVIPHAAEPQVYDPPGHVVATANQRPGPSAGPCGRFPPEQRRPVRGRPPPGRRQSVLNTRIAVADLRKLGKRDSYRLGARRPGDNGGMRRAGRAARRVTFGAQRSGVRFGW